MGRPSYFALTGLASVARQIQEQNRQRRGCDTVRGAGLDSCTPLWHTTIQTCHRSVGPGQVWTSTYRQRTPGSTPPEMTPPAPDFGPTLLAAAFAFDFYRCTGAGSRPAAV